MLAPCDSLAAVASLRERIDALAAGEQGARELVAWQGTSLGRVLPGGGLRRGSLVEWLGVGRGCGATALAIESARQASARRGAVVVVDRLRWFYPPAAAAWGIDLARLLLVRPASEADEAWALHQALLCDAVAAVVAWPRRLDATQFRRLQLAAKTSGALGLLVRSEAARRERSFAAVRLEVRPRPSSRVYVTCQSLHSGDRQGQSVELANPWS